MQYPFILLFFALLMLPDESRADRSADNSGTALSKSLHINVVDDLAEWPPYTYFERNGQEMTFNVTGFSVDVISQILNHHDIEFDIRLLPFTRALRLVKEGEEFQLILNASYVAEREKDYLYTRSHYSLNHVAFYSSYTYPNGLALGNMNDVMDNYKVCGLRGYSYASSGADDSKINMSFGTYDQLIRMLHERPEVCEVFIEGYEVLSGFKAVGQDLLGSGELRHAEISGLLPKGYHMLISRNINYANQLKAIIDDGIIQLKQSGEMKKLLAKYSLVK